jgi:hypothetical protein
MSPRSDDEMDYLLSRGKLGGSQRRRILDAALAAARTPFWARWRGRLAWSGGALALAGGAALLLLTLRAPSTDGDGASSFQVKGPGDAPLITASCLGAQVTACPSGSRLAFALEGGRDAGGFLSAYAVPTPGGERIWYLTNEPVGAPNADASARVLAKAALIGDGQPAGSYRVHVIFSGRALAREALSSLRAGDALAHLELELVVPP